MADRMDRLELRMDRLDASMKKLATDVGEIRTEVRVTNRRVDALAEAMHEGFENAEKNFAEVRRLMAASHAAMTALTRQVSVDKAVEARLRRLETAVFGAKH